MKTYTEVELVHQAHQLDDLFLKNWQWDNESLERIAGYELEHDFVPPAAQRILDGVELPHDRELIIGWLVAP